MMRLVLRAAALTLALTPTAPLFGAEVVRYARTPDGVAAETAGGRLQLLVCSERAVRVLFTLSDGPAPTPSLAVVHPCEGFRGFAVRETKTAVSVVTSRLEARLDRRTGAISFHDPAGRSLLAETAGGRSLVAADVLGQRTHHAEQHFDWAVDEGLYGLGAQQSGLVNYRGHDVLLVQENTVDVVPVLVSSKGYGILWDNASETRLRDAGAAARSAVRAGSLWSQMAEAIDYTFLYGPDLDDVVASYRQLTGQAPLFGRWAYGFWQCKERYRTQQELLDVVREFRRRQVPLDVIVQDWFYWDPFKWGSHRFDRQRYPDPAAMMRELHAMNAKIMISVWAKFVPGSDNHTEMAAHGFLYPPFDEAHGGPAGNSEQYYDAFDPAARELYWRQIDERLFSKGIDAWWLDATEPEIGDLKSDAARAVMAKTALGHGARQLNAYSLMTTEAVYRGQRQADPTKRVFILTRSAFAGQQRNAAATWSGDVQATWDVFAKQVAAGINFGLSGLPYWTTDIGGFFANDYPKGGQDPAYRELFTRWYQWGAFCPIFRVHGTTTPREIWRFGEPGDWAYDTQLRFDRLRYRLLPYIYSLAGHVTHGGGTILRGLPFDFRGDPRVRDIADQHMFGPAFLVSPVLQPLRYVRSRDAGFAIPSSVFAAPDGTPGALQGEYFADKTLGRRVATRKDAAIEFDWGLAAPLPEAPQDQWSARWTGRLRAPETGEYELATLADDGVRLWLDGKLLIDDWNQHAPEYHSGRVTLEAGKSYDFKLEYYDEILGASLELSWTTPSQRRAADAAPSKPMLRRVYLPARTDWYDFWTGERLAGGRSVESPAPLETMPLHVRAGSIVPFGPHLQYASEKRADPIELRVYRGADGRFELYEDEGDGYAYEKGVFATIPIEWSEAKRTLTIGERRGSFPGMLERRTFHVVFVGKGHGTGVEPAAQPDATVSYEGNPVTVVAATPHRPQTRAASDQSPASPAFWSWAATPPMGWNSWDAFGTTITEAQVKEQADFMAAQLLPHGWRLVTVDIQWYEPGAAGHSYRAGAPLAMDEWGRLLPAPNRFPSAAGGAGFRPLADYVHAKGLQFGIHLMRGVPRLAVERKLPVKGTTVTAADIADRTSICPWNPDMYGVDMTKPGAQAYYDSVFELIASWGVDFVKVDDISRPYHEHEREIEAIRRAIDRTKRPIVLSLSPGETALTAAEHVKRHANMWRISDDFWDSWPALVEQFARLARWSPHVGPGHWPDADMLPLGVLDLGRRSTRFTPDEQRTLMTLWSIARSPLIHGGDMTKTDAFTLGLLTNDELIAVDQHSDGNRPLFDHDGLVAWTANVPDSPDRYLALFNARDRFPLDLREPAFASPLVTRATPGHGVAVDVDVRGRSRLVLIVEGGEDGTGWDHALWTEPRLLMEDGSERKLTQERWVQASAGWGDVSTERAPSGGPMQVDGTPVRDGIAAHARSLIEYALPPATARFRAYAALDDGALTQSTGATVRFLVYALPAAAPADPAGLPITVPLADVGLSGRCRVRDLWAHASLPAAEREVVAVVPWHGAMLFRLSPEP